MANYYISGVWLTENNTITHVHLHPTNGNTLLKASKTTEATVIALIESNNVVKTMIWDYSSAWWKTGAEVKVVPINGRKYLRSQKDSTVRDNLDNLIRMNEIL